VGTYGFSARKFNAPLALEIVTLIVHAPADPLSVVKVPL
jgi:hypothetical protein